MFLTTDYTDYTDYFFTPKGVANPCNPCNPLFEKEILFVVYKSLSLPRLLCIPGCLQVGSRGPDKWLRGLRT